MIGRHRGDEGLGRRDTGLGVPISSYEDDESHDPVSFMVSERPYAVSASVLLLKVRRTGGAGIDTTARLSSGE